MSYLQEFKSLGEKFTPKAPYLDLLSNELQITPEKIQGIMTELNITQGYFAKTFCGGLISREMVSRWLSGQTTIQRTQNALMLLCCRERIYLLEKPTRKRVRNKNA